jgi:3-oxoadipate enol-lactonase
MKIKVGDIDIAYDLDGPEGAPVVMLHHSLATSRELWDDMNIALAQNYRVLRFDARGHGATSATAAPYDFAQLAKDAVGLMDTLGIDMAHQVGISMGGMLCQHLGFMAPERCESLTLVSTAAVTPAEAKVVWDQRLADVRANGVAPQLEATLKRWFTPDFLAAGGEEVDLVRKLIPATSVEGYCGWGAAIRDLDIVGSLKGITAPTLVVVGREDPGTPPAAAALIHDNIPGARMEVFSGVSHMLPLQAPDDFIETLMDFIEDCYEDDFDDDDVWDDEA